MANENKTTIIIEGKDTTGAMFNRFGNNLSAAEKQIGVLGGGLSSFTKALGSPINPMMLLGGALTAAAGGFALLMKGAIDSADEIGKAAQKTGFTTEALSKLKYAAELGDIEFGAFEGSLIKFNKAISAAADGSDEQVKAFGKLGISIRENDGSLKDNEKLLLAVAEKFAVMPDGVNKTTTALKLFSKSGAEMIPFLNDGKIGISKLTEEAKKLGLEISKETAKRAQDFNDTMKTMEASLKGAAMQIVEKLLPYLEKMKPVFEDVVIPVIDAGVTKIGGIITSIGSMGKALNDFSKSDGYKALSFLMKFSGGNALLNVGGQDPMIGRYMKNPGLESGQKSKTEIDQVNKMYAEGIAYVPGEGYIHLLPDVKKNKSVNEGGDKPGKDKTTADAEKAAAAKEAKDAKDYSAGVERRQKEAADFLEFMNGTHAQFDNDWATLQAEALDKAQQAGFDYFAAQVDAQQAAVDQQMAMDQLRSDSTMAMFGNMSGAMQNFYQQGGKNAKTYFNLYKAFAISQAIISGKESVMHSFKEGSKWGGPVLGYIFATAAGLFAASQVASIASSSMGGGGSVGTPSSSTPSAPTSSNSNNNQQQTITHTTNIIVYGSVVDHEKFARDISPALENAVRDGSSNLVISN